MSSFLSEVLSSPALATIIVVLLWIYVKVVVDNMDVKKWQIGYTECVVSNQWYRIFSFAFCHESIFHLLLNISALWSLRIAEKLYGTLFIVKYTLVLGLFEAVSTLSLVHWLLKYSRWQFPAYHPIYHTSIYGFTSIILGWLGFLSIDLMMQKKNLLFYVFGLLPMPIPIAPIALMLLSQCILPRSHSLSLAGGLAGGYLLAFGFLKILPNTYWSLCFLVNLLLIFSSLVVRDNEAARISLTSTSRSEDHDILDVIAYEGELTTTSNTEAIARESDHEDMPLLSWNNANHENGNDDDGRLSNMV
jgi:membrane associated rhomboid family serine protease